MAYKLDTATELMDAIALRGLVIFPGSTASLELSRKISINALRSAEENGGMVFLVPQSDPTAEIPTPENLLGVGVVCRILHSSRLNDGTVHVVVEGLKRMDRGLTIITEDIIKCLPIEHEYSRRVTPVQERVSAKKLYEVFSEYLKYITKPREELIEEAKQINGPELLSDFLANNFIVDFNDRLDLLAEYDVTKRIRRLIKIFEKNIDLFNLENSIHQKVRANLQKQQRDIYLREQMRAIKSELGEEQTYDEPESEDEYRDAIENAELPENVKAKLLEENAKLLKTPFGTPEATVIRNYIEVCLELPWNKKSKDRIDIVAARKILDKDHDGIEKVKERILEYIAVKQLEPQLKGQILCFVGPPGVGKTSIAMSIARALNKHFARISLGGIHDEAEIRGHRRTYIGSMPGRVINALKIAGTSNPVILFDELDKLANDMHGDPTSAMLEVLDKEQNNAFRDNFIEIPVDLSECMFIATANTTETIPPALLDRLEIIEMDSYSDSEKTAIAKHHLIPKQLKNHGLKASQCKIKDEAIAELITSYTKENGVRNLEREIASLCRKSAKAIVEGKSKVVIGREELHEMLGPIKFIPDKIYENDEIGIVNGLAWTYLGGDMLRIECSSMKGNGKLELTGHLGDVMKESARAAVSYIRKHCDELGVAEDFYCTKDIHIHVPEGAIPKDGPSAGITIATALVSELTGRSVKQDICMTGEITLTGKVLPIGGLKEKSMAAYKCGARKVIIPAENMSDTARFEKDILDALEFIPVKHVSEVFKLALN